MGKALRMPLGFIAVLAGYEATPAEEMPTSTTQGDDIPFEDGPAQDPNKPSGDTTSGTGGAATNQEVTGLLELAAKVSPDAHDKAVAAVVKQREAHDGQVAAAWLAKQRGLLEKRLPAEQVSFADMVPDKVKGGR
jgi:hypothetical protein